MGYSMNYKRSTTIPNKPQIVDVYLSSVTAQVINETDLHWLESNQWKDSSDKKLVAKLLSEVRSGWIKVSTRTKVKDYSNFYQ